VSIVVDEQRVSRRMWAAIMLARDVWTCESILRGERVRVDHLDPLVLQRAFRGKPVPGGEWIELSLEQLDAIAEAGAIR
jgi:hypothetical protein